MDRGRLASRDIVPIEDTASTYLKWCRTQLRTRHLQNVSEGTHAWALLSERVKFEGTNCGQSCPIVGVRTKGKTDELSS